MKQYGKDDEAFYLEFENIDDATEYRDFLRDCGIYCVFMPDRSEVVLMVRFQDILENFEREFLRLSLVADP